MQFLIAAPFIKCYETKKIMLNVWASCGFELNYVIYMVMEKYLINDRF